MTTLLDRPDLTVDFELMFGEMPEVPCEGSKHGSSDSHDSGPGKHYFRLLHDCETGKAGDIFIRCERKSKNIMRDISRIMLSGAQIVKCPCGTDASADEWVAYVGPVGK